ncbi:TPA: SIMPL domain-containing protein [bacterium]|nr:SIMPL domain-containing protein [bacterium]HPC77572.1 SIMPL domain-containing protein [bacterium]
MKNNQFLLALVIGLSIIISASIVSYTFYRIKGMDNTLSVTGSTRIRVNSDIVKWVGEFSRTVPVDSLKAGYQEMGKDLKVVLEFYKKNSIDPEDLIISPVFLEQLGLYGDRQTPREYLLRQTVEIQSSDLEKIGELSKNLQGLIDSGVAFRTQSLEYYYSKLPELRVNLLTEAMNDAKARAEKIAQSSGQGVGSLRSASMGVVQVLEPNSTEVSDYGSYDTSTIEKEVMVTVRATFLLK